LAEAVKAGFHSGVSMMPLLPYISDTTGSLNAMFSSFKTAGANYVMPATITLFGNGISDSKTLVLRAIEKHYPHLLDKYKKFFSASHELPAYYNKAFYKKMQELSLEYGIKNRIL
jgi:DNA repair photolyase